MLHFPDWMKLDSKQEMCLWLATIPFEIHDENRSLNWYHFALTSSSLFYYLQDDPDRWDPRDGATIIPEKIHVFVLDKRAAKMIR